MTYDILVILTLLAAIGAGLVGGVFFAFWTFVIKALARLPASQGIAAMQSINVVVINPIFMTLLFGTAIVCVIVAIWSVARWGEFGAFDRLIGSMSYFIGTIGVTILCNVPRNDALAKVDPASEEGSRVWTDYVRTWTAWNHVRTLAAIIAMVLLLISVLQ